MRKLRDRADAEWEQIEAQLERQQRDMNAWIEFQVASFALELESRLTRILQGNVGQ